MNKPIMLFSDKGIGIFENGRGYSVAKVSAKKNSVVITEDLGSYSRLDHAAYAAMEGGK